jgi:hypothetical protein
MPLPGLHRRSVRDVDPHQRGIDLPLSLEFGEAIIHAGAEPD